MTTLERPRSLWIIVVFLGISFFLLLAGQTMAVFDNDLAASLGLQESSSQISFLFLFLPGTPGYAYTPGLAIWLSS